MLLAAIGVLGDEILAVAKLPDALGRPARQKPELHHFFGMELDLVQSLLGGSGQGEGKHQRQHDASLRKARKTAGLFIASR